MLTLPSIRLLHPSSASFFRILLSPPSSASDSSMGLTRSVNYEPQPDLTALVINKRYSNEQRSGYDG